MQAVDSNLHKTLFVTARRWQCEGNFRVMENLYYRLNFDPGEKYKINHNNLKKHLQISKIAKFYYEML